VQRLLKRGATAGREDDTPEAIRTRQQVYIDDTAPLLEVYRQRGVLVEVDGLGEVDAVTERLFAALDQRAGSGSALVGGA
jgi:adenylate kinase